MNPLRGWAILRPWQTNAILLMVGLGLLGFTCQLTREFSHFVIGFSMTAGWSVGLYLLAVVVILTQRTDRYTLPLVFSVAVVARVITLFPSPYLSSDIYRYVWDGIVQHAHISPYRYVPGDPVLASLRAPHQWIFDHINRRDYAHTIYPPVAQFIFYLVTLVSPTVTFMKAAMILFEGATIYALLEILTELGYARERCLIYAWCPLLIWEIGSSGHVDSAAIAFIVFALLARYRTRPVFTGLFLGLAVMTKFYPLALLPALYRRGEYKLLAAFGTVVAVGYACYSSVGLRVFGFLGGYVKEEGIDSGTRYFLLELAQRGPGLSNLSTTTYLAFAGLVFAVLFAWCWRTCSATETASPKTTGYFGMPAKANFFIAAFLIATALMLLFSPHYPWYIAWLVPFLVIVPNLTVFVYVCAFFYMCTTALAVGSGPHQFLLNEIVYGVTFAAFILDMLLWRMRTRALYLRK